MSSFSNIKNFHYNKYIKIQSLKSRYLKKWTKKSIYQKISCTTEKKASKQMLVHVPPHPLIKHWLSILRSELTPAPLFRNAIGELGKLLGYEATRNFLPTLDSKVETPFGEADVTYIDPYKEIKIIPILRDGIVLEESVRTLIPISKTYHIGCQRDEKTLKASIYFNKLPESFTQDDLIIITDTMLATGNTIMLVLNELVNRGANPENIKVITIVAAPPALKAMSEAFSGLIVYCAIIDPEVNSNGYIVPGIGDVSVRCFGM